MWFGCITFTQILAQIRFRYSHEHLVMHLVCGVNVDTKEGRKCFISTHFILRLYGVGHMVKDHSDSERGTWATLSD